MNSYYFIFIYLFLNILIQTINCQIFRGPQPIYGLVNATSMGIDFAVTEKVIGTSHSESTFSRYQFYFLRLHIKNNKTNFQAYIDFHPKVDEFTTLIIPGSNILFNKNYKNVKNDKWVPSDAYTVSIELLAAKEEMKPCFENEILSSDPICVGVTSTTTPMINYKTIENLELPPKRIADFESETFIGSFGIVIQLDNGKITDVQWEGDRKPEICKSCDKCLDDQCAVNYSDMKCDFGDGCQLKFMVAWVGQDNKGKACQSINKLPSNFQKYSSTPLKNIGLGLINDFFYRVSKNTNNPNVA